MFFSPTGIPAPPSSIRLALCTQQSAISTARSPELQRCQTGACVDVQDVGAALARLPKSADAAAAEARAAGLRGELDAAAAAVDALRNKCAYRWVSLRDICC